MNLAAFEAFVKVMETGSISLAADQLFITQPAVTKRIHSLEEYFGVKLFESAGRGVQATHAAHSLLPKVKNWLNELGDIHYTLNQKQFRKSLNRLGLQWDRKLRILNQNFQNF